jgi:hypothetical protein
VKWVTGWGKGGLGGGGGWGKETGSPHGLRFYLLLGIFPSVMTGGVFLVGGGGGVDRHYRSEVISPLRPCHKEMSNTRTLFA